MRKIILLAMAVALIGAACNKQVETIQEQPYSDGTINIANRVVSIEIADQPAEQARGLSGRTSIEENQGMLFNFSVPFLPTFWMRGMNFPIDIVWIKGDEVIDITRSAQPEPGVPDGQLKTYSPKTPADRVLELKDGWADRNGLKIGDKIEIIQVVQ